jgi:hypothetical protein
LRWNHGPFSLWRLPYLSSPWLLGWTSSRTPARAANGRSPSKIGYARHRCPSAFEIYWRHVACVHVATYTIITRIFLPSSCRNNSIVIAYMLGSISSRSV